MLPILYDLVILAILAFFLWRGWRKGLLLSLCGLVVVILSLVGANFIADTAAPPVAKALQPKLAAVIEENVNDYMATHYDDIVPSDAPASTEVNPWDALREMGGIYALCADSVEEAIGQFSRSLDLSEMYAIAANRVAEQLAHHILFAVAFVVLFVLLTLLLHALDLVAKLPGLHFCNGLGGGLIGLIKGVLVLFVVVTVLGISSRGLFSPEVVEKTYLCKFLVEINPVLAFFPPT